LSINNPNEKKNTSHQQSNYALKSDRSQPDNGHWWWFLDRVVADKKREKNQRVLRWGLVIIGFLIIVYLVYQFFLAPDESQQARLQHENSAQEFVIAGNFPAALNEVEQALAYAPEDPYLLVLQGILQARLGQPDNAAASLMAAEKAFSNRETYLVTRGQGYLRVGEGELALADAQEVIAQNPQSGGGYLILGQAYEVLNNIPEAISVYEHISTLPNVKEEFVVLARMRLGALIQQR